MYIHYGHGGIYHREKFKPIKNINYQDVSKIKDGHTTKPKFRTGLWASDIESPLNWRALCYAFKLDGLKAIKNKDYFLFDFLPNANVIHITCPDDFNKVPHLKNVREGEINILFEEALKQGIDAIELHLESKYQEQLEQYLYGWDCSCIIVLNPYSIEQVCCRVNNDKICGYDVF